MLTAKQYSSQRQGRRLVHRVVLVDGNFRRAAALLYRTRNLTRYWRTTNALASPCNTGHQLLLVAGYLRILITVHKLHSFLQVKPALAPYRGFAMASRHVFFFDIDNCVC
jgi:hypothetical protein